MSRYILPLSVLAVIAFLIGLIAMSGKSSVDYAAGVPRVQQISDEWVKGNATSSVVLVEYSDFQCPACKAYNPLIEQVMEKYGNRIAFVFRHYPLYQKHPNADLAARASEAAGMQGKFWQMHDVLFARQEQWSTSLSAEKLFKQYAQEIGLDAVVFEKDIKSAAVRQAVADDYARGVQDQVSWTPTFVLNGVRIQDNPGSLVEFSQLIDQLVR